MLFCRLRSVALLGAAMSLSGCAGLAALMQPPAPAGSVVVTGQALTPLGNTVVDEQAIDTAYRALDVAALAASASVATKLITPGSPRALTIAHGLDTVRDFLNAANEARKAGNATTLAQAWAASQLALKDVQLALLNK